MSLLAEIHNDLEKGALRLIAEYRDRLFADATRLCRDTVAAEDLVSRTFDKVIRNLDSYKQDDNFLGWMRTIMVNLHRDEQRNPVRRGTAPVDPKVLEESAAADWSADELILKHSDSEALKDAISRLDPEYKKILVMHYFGELPVKNIALALNLPLGTVLWRLSLARRMLAKDLGAKLGKKPVATVLAILLAAGTLWGAWQIGVCDGFGVRREPRQTVQSSAEKEKEEMQLSAPGAVAAMATAVMTSCSSIAAVPHVADAAADSSKPNAPSLMTASLSAPLAPGAIQWNVARNITGDADVETDGTLLYAIDFTKPTGAEPCVVNGVPFVPSENVLFFVHDAIELSGFAFVSDRACYARQIPVEETFSNNYRLLLDAAVGTASPSTTQTIRLKRLIRGRRYRVQLWGSSDLYDCGDGVSYCVDDNALRIHQGAVGRPGQFITGTFTATGESALITITHAETVVLVNALQVRDVSPNVISWEAPQNIGADVDVATEGTLCWAFTQSCRDVTVNGVPFTGVYGAMRIPNTVAGLECLTMDGFAGSDSDQLLAHFAATDAMSADYAELLRGCAFGSQDVVGTMTLKNLVAGHSYLVQLWVNDNRMTGDFGMRVDFGYAHSLLLDGTTRVRYQVERTPFSYGQWVVGRFVAATDTLSFTLTPETADSVACPSSMQWNAIQLRDVTPGQIAWEAPKDILADTDVRTEGLLVDARQFVGDGAPRTVNGVTFASGIYSIRQNDHESQKWNLHKTDCFAFEGFEQGHADVFMQDAAPGAAVSADYATLLGGAFYGGRGGMGSVTMRDLVPGMRYLVQFWITDARAYRQSENILRLQIDNQRLQLAVPANGRLGQHVTGVFTATSPTQTFAVRSLSSYAPEISLHVNAVQLRRLLDAPAGVDACSAVFVTSEADISAEGTSRYAYSFAAADQTVNGTLFRRCTTPTKLGDDVELVGVSDFHSTAFVENSTISPDALRALLAGAAYGNGAKNDNATLLVTLKNLTPGKRYLAQFVVNDNRYLGDMAWIIYPGIERSWIYRNPDEPRCGSVATYRFRATGTTKTFEFGFVSPDRPTNTVQLNALQVRELAEDGAAFVWTGTEGDAWTTAGTGWARGGAGVEGRPWDTENGVQNVAVVSDASVRLGEDVCVHTLYAVGSVTVGDEGEAMMLDVRGEVAGEATINVAWAAPTLTKTSEGTLTLGGSVASLERVVQTAGKLMVLHPETLARPPDFFLGERATLTVPAGTTLPASSLGGNGTVTGPGTLALRPETRAELHQTFTGLQTLALVGRGELVFCGTHTGALSIENAEGRFTLCSDDAAPLVLRGGPTAVFDLGDQTPTVAVCGGGRVENGTLASPVELTSAVEMKRVVFAEGGVISISTMVARAFSHAREAFLTTAADCVGDPGFALPRGFLVEQKTLENGVRTYTLLDRSGTMLLLR